MISENVGNLLSFRKKVLYFGLISVWAAEIMRSCALLLQIEKVQVDTSADPQRYVMGICLANSGKNGTLVMLRSRKT